MIQIKNLTKTFKVKKKGHGIFSSLFSPKYEIFKVVDDASTDGTKDLVKKYKNKISIQW